MADLAEIQRSLGRVEGKLDAALNRMDARDREEAAQNKRIENVERRQWWLSGVAAAIGALLGIGGSNGLKL